jgi:glycosyltransferase involved in cell wall biosynthesis
MNLLALVDSPEHVCCRYRIRAFEPALSRRGWSLTCRALRRGPLARLRQLAEADQYDAVILQRKLLPPWELAFLRRHARQLAFDFDDAVLFRDSYDRRGPYSDRRERRFAATVNSADVVLAGNDFLADCALRAGAAPSCVRTIPTCVDTACYPEPTELGPCDRSGGEVDLVWIGSASTLRGLQRQQPLLDRLGRELPGLRLRVICDQFPRFQRLPVIPVPWAVEWEGRDLAAGQIGISWLPDDPWSRGKCGLKVLQYQAARLPVVANPVGVQAELIEPGATGFLPSTEREWLEAVRALALDPARRQSMGQLARSRVESGFSVAAWAEAFVTAVTATDKLGRSMEVRFPAARSIAIPEPFYARLKRLGHLPRPQPVSHFDGTRSSK